MELTVHQHQVLASNPIELNIPWDEITNVMADALHLHEHEKITSIQATFTGLKIEVGRPGKYKTGFRKLSMLLTRWMYV